MGAADTVPGVSGGTVALILGHYTRLVTAISHFDRTALAMLGKRQWSKLIKHLDLIFLLLLGIGIILGIGTLSGAMHWMLDHHLPETFAAFLGFLLASVWIVKDKIRTWYFGTWLAFIGGAAAAIAISLLQPSTADASLGYLFVAGAVAICAMILPGISGAFVLLLFGVYHLITGIIKDTVKLQIELEALVSLGVFALGCGIGLLAFSKLLRHLLQHHRDLTMATLVGLMAGSVVKLYPLQRPTAETADWDLKDRVMESFSPARWDQPVWHLLIIVVVSAVVIGVIERRFGESDSQVDSHSPLPRADIQQ